MSENTKYNIIVAHDRNNGIGNNNSIPWYCKPDLLNFKNLTIGNNNNAIIMGKNTWNSLPYKPLKNRTNIIISSTLENKNENKYKVFNSIEAAVLFCNNANFEEVWIIGGENIYRDFLTKMYINSLYITYIDKEYICNKYFPQIQSNFKCINTKIIQTQNNETPSAILKYYNNTIQIQLLKIAQIFKINLHSWFNQWINY